VRPEEVDFARRALGQSLQRSLESSRSRLAVLEGIGRYGHPDDFLERRLAWLAGATAAELDVLARRHVRPDELVVLVVGDREAVRGPLAELGLGPPIELDAYGFPR
jgi:zinc protease